jgi:hypothetical protein
MSEIRKCRLYSACGRVKATPLKRCRENFGFLRNLFKQKIVCKYSSLILVTGLKNWERRELWSTIGDGTARAVSLFGHWVWNFGFGLSAERNPNLMFSRLFVTPPLQMYVTAPFTWVVRSWNARISSDFVEEFLIKVFEYYWQFFVTRNMY